MIANRVRPGRRRVVGGSVLLGLLMAVAPAPAAAAPQKWARTTEAEAAMPAHGRWTAPVGPLDALPVVVHPYAAPAGPYGAGHRGTDLRAAAGSVVRAAGAGVVTFAGLVAGRPVVTVTHRGGLRTTYEPVLAGVRTGAVVSGGEPLGSLVSVASHCRPLPCLHWGAVSGIRDYRDPMALLRRGPVVLLPLGTVAHAATPAARTVDISAEVSNPLAGPGGTPATGMTRAPTVKAGRSAADGESTTKTTLLGATALGGGAALAGAGLSGRRRRKPR